MDDRFTPVRVANAWWSAKPHAVPVTVVTQLSADRVEQLVAQCKSWPGPISAVLYMPVLVKGDDDDEARAKVHAAEVQMAAFFADVDKSLPCQLDLMLAYEFFDSQRTMLLYPVNVLRNYARLQARTPIIGLLDADMVISHTLFEELTSDSGELLRRLMANPDTLTVLPAFSARKRKEPLERGSGGLDLAAASKLMALSLAELADAVVAPHVTKARVHDAWSLGMLTRFDPVGEGHVPTNYAKWFHATKPYQVHYEKRYEPWVLCSRSAVPWYDARFRGYGQNKIVHLEHMNATGFTFEVHPGAWIVHRAHQPTAAKLQHAQDFLLYKKEGSEAANRTVYGHATVLGAQVRAALARDMAAGRGAQAGKGGYQPVVDPATRACAGELPWWGMHE